MTGKAKKNYYSFDMIHSCKIPAANTSGYKDVFHIRGRYTAKIVFPGECCVFLS